MNNEQLLLCACAILLAMLVIQSCWMKQDTESAELALDQLEWKNEQLQKELDKRDSLTFRDLVRDAAAQDAVAQTEAPPLALVG